MEAAKVIAGLTRMVRDVGLAEDFAQTAGTADHDIHTPATIRRLFRLPQFTRNQLLSVPLPISIAPGIALRVSRQPQHVVNE